MVINTCYSQEMVLQLIRIRFVNLSTHYASLTVHGSVSLVFINICKALQNQEFISKDLQYTRL